MDTSQPSLGAAPASPPFQPQPGASNTVVSISLQIQYLLEFFETEYFASLEAELGDNEMEEFAKEIRRCRWFRKLTAGG
ncbi:hypothetical protein BC938DRAFT_474518 [Jimgerdemannia flammicorona]|uniref:Uncharacterized protein n=1 Tax=Jimgerdemannia flammicorona TaxID=994334 RepID=A0A433Q296_9FUNG|nr:hypothetical protein BC938DRAFT_474518 [Jimgerdemannia flammicorona]